MEDYDEFVQHRLIQLRKREEYDEEEHHRSSTTTSLIRIYGRPILPPLLSAEQREEMQRHRDAAQTAAGQRKLKDDPRMAYVQTILHSVQLRKLPTLEELLQEPDTNTESLYCLNTSGGSESNCHFLIETKDDLSFSPSTVKTGEDESSLPSVTSAMSSAFFSPDVTPQQSYSEGCLLNQHDSQRGAQPIPRVFPDGAVHQSLSSGYMTCENVDNTICVSEVIDAGSESCGSEDVYSIESFFLHSTSNTITKMPEIISHSPVDGEELENSGLESSYCNNFITVKDIRCTSFHEDSFIGEQLTSDKCENSYVEKSLRGDSYQSAALLDLDKDHISDRSKDPVSSPENSDFSVNPELSETLSSHQDPTTHLCSQHEPTDKEPVDNREDEAEPSEEPYRLSLQALLKKSQEYRRRQRMLRNQAKNTKLQERTPQPKTRPEEQNLSDKENDESPYETAEEKKTKEKRHAFIPTMEMSLKKSWENERLIETEHIREKINGKSESSHLKEDMNSKEITKSEEQTTIENNKLNSSPEVIIKSNKITALIDQQSVSTEASTEQEAFHMTTEQSNTSPKGVFQKVRKCYTIPALNVCMSPVHAKSKGSVRVEDQGGGVQTSKEKAVLSAGVKEDHSTEEESNQRYHSSHREVPSTLNVIVQGDVRSVLSKSSVHIDQLESNLSSLKVMFSDLESTMKENFDKHIQTESNPQSEFNSDAAEHSKQSEDDVEMQLRQNRCDLLEDKLGNDTVESSGAKYMEHMQRRQSLDNSKNMHEDKGSEVNLSDLEDVPAVIQAEKKEAVNLREIRLVKTLAVERLKEKGKEGLTKCQGLHGSCRKQQPPAKCILSAAQWLRIPDAFRTTPPEIVVPCKDTVLSDTSNHEVERRNEMVVKGHNSAHSLSLNKSFDVDTPSGLWLLEGLGSDLDSRENLVHEKHLLTPESGGEGQDGISKVKRRLLMHTTGETTEKSPDTSRGAGLVVRPCSSTPKATVRHYDGHGSQGNKEEQLKQAHAAQIRALQDEHRRQQEELLQALAARYHLLQSVSLPCSMSTSRLGDTLTFSSLSQPSSPIPEHCRPLLLAAVKGFLTRRLLRTERVVQLVRTIRDTQQFLCALQLQSSSRAELRSRQDLLLQERVFLQLRAARYDFYDIFFSLSAAERMQLINWDRDLAQEREHRRLQSGHPQEKRCLSAATRKSLERKKTITKQRVAAERDCEVVAKNVRKTGLSGRQPLETKQGQFRANPLRVRRSTNSTRPR
ncbi:uncharacterized protein si:ch73-100l22.3 isoform X1 [Solea solea]|uniref:uncharacterized protein si:ch73-100l22.3 isoform X1 n=1 Tax=Solea solea TaxID=90069 RepID=UPI00272CC3AD|nr:uncharacterized protein si:ch73-100l22.3 isoform X1 [Solea solea]